MKLASTAGRLWYPPENRLRSWEERQSGLLVRSRPPPGRTSGAFRFGRRWLRSERRWSDFPAELNGREVKMKRCYFSRSVLTVSFYFLWLFWRIIVRKQQSDTDSFSQLDTIFSLPKIWDMHRKWANFCLAWIWDWTQSWGVGIKSKLGVNFTSFWLTQPSQETSFLFLFMTKNSICLDSVI